MEVMRPRIERSVFARSARFNSEAGNRLVPLAWMGLHIEKGHDDDTAEGLSSDRNRGVEAT